MLQGINLPGPAPSHESIYRSTGGHPLFIVETLKSSLESGELERTTLRGLLPPKVSEVLNACFRRLTPNATHALQLLGIAQQNMTFDLALGVLGLSEAVLTELEAAQMIGGLAFSHDLIYEAVNRTMPKSVAQLLRKRAADAMRGE